MSILVQCLKKDFSSLLFLINGWCRNIVFRHVVNHIHNAPFVKTYAIKLSVWLHLVVLCWQKTCPRKQFIRTFIHWKHRWLNTSFWLVSQCSIMREGVLAPSFLRLNHLQLLRLKPTHWQTSPVAAEPSGEIDARPGWCHLSLWHRHKVVYKPPGFTPLRTPAPLHLSLSSSLFFCWTNNLCRRLRP